MGRVLTGVNHPIETDRGLWARAGWSRGENEDSSGEMTRTETETLCLSFTGVDGDTGKHCLTRLGIKTDFIGAFCSQFPVRG